jgi:hypothetical protein
MDGQGFMVITGTIPNHCRLIGFALLAMRFTEGNTSELAQSKKVAFQTSYKR